MWGKLGQRVQPRLLSGVAAIIMVTTAVPATAQTHRFNVRGQLASTAIATFARQADVQILARESVVHSKRTNSVKGSYSVDDGLRLLLRGTGLRAIGPGSSGIITIQSDDSSETGSRSLDQAAPPVATASDDGTAKGQDIIVTGVNSRLPAQLSSFPGSVTVVSKAEIAAQLAINPDVGSILANEIPGLSVSSYTASDANQTLRGRPLSYYIDGIPISIPLRDGGRSQRAVPSSALSGIEVIRGSTAIYGNGGNGGSVNYITKRPDGPDGITGTSDVSLGASLTHPSDSFDPRIAQDFTAKSGGFDFVFSGAYERKQGLFDAQGDRIAADPTGNGGISDSDIYNLFTKAGYNFGHNRLEAGLIYYDQAQNTNYGLQILGNEKLGIKTLPGLGQVDPRVIPQYSRNFIGQASYINDAVLGGTLRLQSYHENISQLFAFNATRAGGTQSRIGSKKDGLRLDLHTPLDRLGIGNGSVLWGAEYVRDQSVQDVNTNPVRVFVPRLDQKTYSAFAQIELKPFKGFTIQGGTRYDKFHLTVDDFTVLTTGLSVKGGSVNYDSVVFNVGASQHLAGSLTIYAGFSQGFSLPDVGLQIRATTLTNPLVTLRPQPVKVNNYEVGLRGTFSAVDFSLAGFISTSKLGQTFTPCPDDIFVNCVTRAAERLYGIEATLNGRALNRRLRWGGTFSLVKGDQDSNGDGQVDTPLPNNRVGPVKVTGYATYAITPVWSARIQGVYSGSRSEFPALASTSTGAFGDIHPYFVADASTTFDFGPGKMTFAVNNLLNKFYFPVAAQLSGNLPARYVPSPGTTARISYVVKY